MGLNPGQRTKILHATQHGQKNQNKKKKRKKIRMARVNEEKNREHELPLSLANEINGS